jgi:hypothetical protein
VGCEKARSGLAREIGGNWPLVGDVTARRTVGGG